MKNKIFPVLSMGFLILAVFWAGPAEADIYKYVDENGVMHFTNVPTSTRYKVFIHGRSKSRSLSYTTDKYDHYIKLASRLYDIPFTLVKAIIKVESNFNRHAVSKKGARGLMQIMPDTAKILKVYDPFDPWENIMAGTKYLKMLLKRFDSKIKYALAGYNAGPEKVEKYKGIPPYEETINYVKKVLQYYRYLSKKKKKSPKISRSSS